MNPTREEALFALALKRFVECRISSRKQITPGQQLEEPWQRQHAQRAVLQFHRADVNAEAGLKTLIRLSPFVCQTNLLSGRCAVQVNDQIVTDFVDESNTHTAGHLALQQSGTSRNASGPLVTVRNVMVKPLPDDAQTAWTEVKKDMPEIRRAGGSVCLTDATSQPVKGHRATVDPDVAN